MNHIQDEFISDGDGDCDGEEAVPAVEALEKSIKPLMKKPSFASSSNSKEDAGEPAPGTPQANRAAEVVTAQTLMETAGSPRLKRALKTYVDTVAESSKHKRPKAVSMDMYPKELEQALVLPGDLSKMKAPLAKSKAGAKAKAAPKAVAATVAKGKAKASAKPKAEAAAKAGGGPPTVVEEPPTAKGWTVRIYTRTTGALSGQTYKVWKAPCGKLCRAFKEAIALGFDG